MTSPRALSAALLVLAAGVASAAVTQGRFWIRMSDDKPPVETLRLTPREGGEAVLWVHLGTVILSREEAASLGRALLEAAGETEHRESACGLLKRYIAIRENELAVAELSLFQRNVHENEITALRTKIQEKALDGWCR